MEAYKAKNQRARELKQDNAFFVEMSDAPLDAEKVKKLKAKLEAKFTKRYEESGKDVITRKRLESTQATDAEEYQRPELDTSKLPDDLATLISQLLEQLEQGSLD